jgi:hypothetical protein
MGIYKVESMPWYDTHEQCYYNTITINGNTVSLGGSINVTASDPFTVENAQDAAALLFTNGVHTGLSFSYDDDNSRLNGTVVGYISIQTLKEEVLASTSFEDFQSRIAAL